MPEQPREYACPVCGSFVMKATVPSGWSRVYCKVCKAWRTIYTGKDEALTRRTA